MDDLGIRKLNPADLGHVVLLLELCDLPIDDVTEDLLADFVGIEHSGSLAAVGGLELYPDSALLRSVAVHPHNRKQGLAKAIVDHLEQSAREARIGDMYLLTEKAVAYFKQRGYDELPRDQAPPSIAGTRQFSGLCPGNAAFMHKSL